MDVLDDVNSGVYKRTMVNDNKDQKKETNKEKALKPNSGKIIYKNNIIKFEKVPLVTPNGDILIPELSFEVTSGINVLICGPNGKIQIIICYGFMFYS